VYFFILYYSFSLFPFFFVSLVSTVGGELYSCCSSAAVENYNISFFIVTQPYLGGFISPNDNLTPGDEWSRPAPEDFFPPHPRFSARSSHAALRSLSYCRVFSFLFFCARSVFCLMEKSSASKVRRDRFLRARRRSPGVIF